MESSQSTKLFGLNNTSIKAEFTKLAHEFPDYAVTNEMIRSHVGGMSHFNCLYQMKLALTSRLHSKLALFKQQKKKNVAMDFVDHDEKEIALSSEATKALCDNFDLVNELIRNDPLASSDILETILHSIGRLNLNALSTGPTKPMKKLETILQSLLLDATKHPGTSLLRYQQNVFSTSIEFALTFSSAPRLLSIIETLLKCIQSNTSQKNDLLFPLPRTLLTLANTVRNTHLCVPDNKYIVDEYKINALKYN
eukprot:534861_1